MERLIKLIYFVLGVLFSVGGIVALFFPSLGLPHYDSTTEGSNIEGIRTLTSGLIHSNMELGVSFIGLGLIMIWSAMNRTKARALDLLFLLFFALLSGIHWYEFFQGNRPIVSPLFNSIPLVLITGIIIFRKK